ncbi:Cof-type HAD-IIB family hydrolase [Anaerocolumna cellulosilytica]|uniref:Cof-type HAD-IIB family hydrolase n=1 Tax=Anaerocolumna cellulosilytica TaxID=433286 RepID=A0A6S6RDA8_9FIRM|nr:HAD family hydrolase [Anaerocolumna cellulosilytica]MBB5195315.1 hypothetical protein [Anaerocolumna cellulosilytica]BCJ96788.1 Cof-type HAD-IIB family hydrolase [Anaerocolumna cellulosilytica]
MKTLYISDLDGTLLNEAAQLSPYTIETLNEQIQRGMDFSIATARSLASVKTILAPLNLNLPIVLMNGAAIYDMDAGSYKKVEYLSPSGLNHILNVIHELDLSGFLYEINNSELTTYYQNLETKALKDFYNERVHKYNKYFVQIPNFAQLDREHLMYFTLLDTKEKLEPAYKKLKEHGDLAVAFYRDIYPEEELWYLEIFSTKATKYNAVAYLRNQLQYDVIIGFGDNLNDLPFFKACDKALAVENARVEVKTAAHEIIGHHKEDGVAKWIRRNVSL